MKRFGLLIISFFAQAFLLIDPVQATHDRAQNAAVNRIYREILERDAEPAGMITWTNALTRGKTIEQVRRAIAESPEAQKKLNDLYLSMLCRPIDPTGRATWTNALASGWTLWQVASEGIFHSPEYENRGGRPCN